MSVYQLDAMTKQFDEKNEQIAILNTLHMQCAVYMKQKFQEDPKHYDPEQNGLSEKRKMIHCANLWHERTGATHF